MTRYLKEDHEVEQKVQEVEELMRKHEISLICYGGNGITLDIKIKNKRYEFWIQSKETGQKITSFPRTFDEERLALWE